MKQTNPALSIHNRNSSNIPKDLNELLRDFKRKNTNTSINISNLPQNKPKKKFKNIENFTTEKLNKNSFVKKYNDIMSEISTDYILVQPKSNNEIIDNRRHLKNLSLNNFIKSQIEKESPLKNIKKGILNTKIEDVDFDNFYMDSHNINSIAKLSESNKLLNNLKKNELLTNYQTKLNGNNNNCSNAFSGSVTERNTNAGGHARSSSHISLQIKRDDKFLINEDELNADNFNLNSNFKNQRSIKNDFSKITNILNFSNFNKSLVKKKSINSREDFSESIRKNNNNNNIDKNNCYSNSNFNNSMKNSSGKTFYSTLCKTPNSKMNGNNNNNECVISNYSHESISPERRNLCKDNQNKIGNYKTAAANFFNYKNSLRHQDSLDFKSSINENNVANNNNNYNYKVIENPYRKEFKSNLLIEKFNSLDFNCVEKITDKIKFDNPDSPMKKRDSCSVDVSSNNISNFNTSRNLNFVAKSELNNINNNNNNNNNFDSVNNAENDNSNKYKNNDKRGNSLDLLSLDNLVFDTKETGKNALFVKIDSLYSSKHSVFKAKEIRNNSLFAEKYISMAKSKSNSNTNKNNSSKFNISAFSTIRNELDQSSNYRNKDNITKGIVLDSNFDYESKFNNNAVKKTLTFELIKNGPCKYNKFNNFKHLREEVDNAELNSKKNRNNLFNKPSSNFNRVSTGRNNDIELTFSKNANSFINKNTIVNKIEATKRLKLK